MTKQVQINGKIFEVVKPYKGYSNARAYYDMYISTRVELSDCYTRPSQAKQSIYSRWKQWFYATGEYANVEAIAFGGIASYNTNIFTLQGAILINQTRYIIQITPTHNRLIEVIE